MATPKMEIRTPEPIQEAIRAAAERNGRSFAQEVNATLGEKYLGEEPTGEVAPPRKAAKPASAPVAVITGADLAKVEAGGASMKLAMERAGVAQWDPSAKRPQYQKGASAKGKGGR